MNLSNVRGEKEFYTNIALVKDTLPTHRGGNLMETKLTRIREIAEENPKERFTSLYHLLNLVASSLHSLRYRLPPELCHNLSKESENFDLRVNEIF